MSFGLGILRPTSEASSLAASRPLNSDQSLGADPATRRRRLDDVRDGANFQCPVHQTISLRKYKLI